MAGAWSGEGRVDMSNGQSERIRCRARYDVGGGGTLLRQYLRCASASYDFDVQSTVTYRDGTISGTWSESTRNINGQVTGVVRSGHILARVDAGTFEASLTVTTSGNSQRVSIVPQGTDVRDVAVALRRQ